MLPVANLPTPVKQRLLYHAWNVLTIMFTVVICPPIHNIVVVTSPIGVQAPPALAAMIIIPANHNLSLWSFKILAHKEIITIAVFKLSRIDDKKKVKVAITNINFTKLLVLILSVINEKPLCVSINSTMVMAPNKKKTIEDISDK